MNPSLSWEFDPRHGWHGRLKLGDQELISIYVEQTPDFTNGWMYSCPDLGIRVPVKLPPPTSDSAAKVTAARAIQQRAADIFSALNNLRTLKELV